MWPFSRKKKKAAEEMAVCRNRDCGRMHLMSKMKAVLAHIDGEKHELHFCEKCFKALRQDGIPYWGYKETK